MVLVPLQTKLNDVLAFVNFVNELAFLQLSPQITCPLFNFMLHHFEPLDHSLVQVHFLLVQNEDDFVAGAFAIVQKACGSPIIFVAKQTSLSEYSLGLCPLQDFHAFKQIEKKHYPTSEGQRAAFYSE